ncbi:class I SAM-dependent methyltransferase [Dactylosporangium sp. NPDC000555]|uniref:class I SAM-dependent methyltransferase n=1 Tax=Dactylosporangium sp. NPDC000555 TaxID=3154260 RepID=UPI0033192ECC
MLEIQDYRLSLRRSAEARTRPDRPSTFVLNGREWYLLPGVFAPVFSPTTGFALDLLGLDVEVPSSMLEIGCGTGVIAVSAALAGCQRVVASDINPDAVCNAALNASRHHCSPSVRAVYGDLFSGLDPAERFDLVYWHSNYVHAPGSYRYASIDECAYVDPGYAAHRRFLHEAPGWVTPGGRVLLHFSGRGDREELERLAGETGRRLSVLRRHTYTEGDHTIEHLLIEIRPR